MGLGISQFFRSDIRDLAFPYLRHCLLFMLLGSAWIILSDRALSQFLVPADILNLSEAQTAKGIFFVVVTSLLFFALLRRTANNLRTAHHYLSCMSEIAGATCDIIWRCDPQGQKVEIIEFSCAQKLHSGKGLTQRSIHPDDRDAERRTWALALAQKKPFTSTIRLFVDGCYRHFEENVFPILNRRGEVIEWFGACRDIEEFVQTQAELRRSEESLRLAAEAGGIGIWDWDLDQDRLHISKEMQRQHGAAIASPSELRKYILPDDYKSIRRDMLAAKYHAKSFDVEYRIKSSDGKLRWILNKGKAFADDQGASRRMLGVSIDVSRIKKTEERYRYLAHHDSITQAPNRRSGKITLAAMIKQCERRNSRFAALIVDIDYFSSLNETYGHKIGDAVLKEVAARLEAALTAEEYVCRYAADAFLVLVSTQGDKLKERIEELRAVLDKPFTTKGFPLFLGFSGGVSYFPEHGRTSSSLLRSAQLALNHAKEVKRGCIESFSDEMREKFHRFEVVRNALAVAAEKQEFSLNFQAQLDTRLNKLCGFEVLIRWSSPELGAVSPVEFIPVAERIGVIDKIDHFILDGIAKQLSDWRGRGYCVPRLGYNLSPAVLEHKDAGMRLHQMVRGRGIGPEDLLLEITETAMIHDAGAVLNNLETLSGLGYAIAIDDFGTGFSSLDNLIRIRPEKIKIDKSFVQSIDQSPEQAAMVRGLIRMAHDMGVQVVAEGVETEQQLHWLKDWGCDIVQGYFYSKPAPGDAAETFLLSKA